MPGIWARLSPADVTSQSMSYSSCMTDMLYGWACGASYSGGECMRVLLTRWNTQSGNPDLKPLLVTQISRFPGDSLRKLQPLRAQLSHKVKDIMILPQLTHSVCPHPWLNLFSTTATHQTHTVIFITTCACVPRTHSEHNTKGHHLWLACRFIWQVAQFVTYWILTLSQTILSYCLKNETRLNSGVLKIGLQKAAI